MGRAERIQSFREARANARARGDASMVHCMDVELARLDAPLETATPEAMETAVPPRPRRGRPPRPRCEHDQLADRCPTCNPEADLKTG